MFNKRLLSNDDQVDIIIQLIKARILDLKLNCLHEVELVPIGFDYKTWYWLLEDYGISGMNQELMSKIMLSLHMKGIVLAKHIETV